MPTKVVQVERSAKQKMIFFCLQSRDAACLRRRQRSASREECQTKNDFFCFSWTDAGRARAHITRGRRNGRDGRDGGNGGNGTEWKMAATGWRLDGQGGGRTVAAERVAAAGRRGMAKFPSTRRSRNSTRRQAPLHSGPGAALHCGRKPAFSALIVIRA